MFRNRSAVLPLLLAVLIATSGMSGCAVTRAIFGDSAPKTPSGQVLLAEDVSKQMIVLGMTKVAELNLQGRISPTAYLQVGGLYTKWQTADTAALTAIAAWRASNNATTEAASRQALADLEGAGIMILAEIGKYVGLTGLKSAVVPAGK